MIINDNLVYSMKLHKRLAAENIEIICVPGGWIYTQYFTPGIDRQLHVTSCFVPREKK